VLDDVGEGVLGDEAMLGSMVQERVDATLPLGMEYRLIAINRPEPMHAPEVMDTIHVPSLLLLILQHLADKAAVSQILSPSLRTINL